MICAICSSGITEEGARVLHSKAICRACVTELIQGSVPATPLLDERQRDEREPDIGGGGTCGQDREAIILQELNAELARLGVTEEDLGPNDCTSVQAHGDLFRITDGYSSVVASGEKLLERLRMLPDGVGDHATWCVLADL